MDQPHTNTQTQQDADADVVVAAKQDTDQHMPSPNHDGEANSGGKSAELEALTTAHTNLKEAFRLESCNWVGAYGATLALKKELMATEFLLHKERKLRVVTELQLFRLQNSQLKHELEEQATKTTKKGTKGEGEQTKNAPQPSSPNQTQELPCAAASISKRKSRAQRAPRSHKDFIGFSKASFSIAFPGHEEEPKKGAAGSQPGANEPTEQANMDDESQNARNSDEDLATIAEEARAKSAANNKGHTAVDNDNEPENDNDNDNDGDGDGDGDGDDNADGDGDAGSPVQGKRDGGQKARARQNELRKLTQVRRGKRVVDDVDSAGEDTAESIPSSRRGVSRAASTELTRPKKKRNSRE